MYDKILVPLDGSELAEAVLPHVEEVARKTGADVVLFQAVESPSLGSPSGKPDMEIYKQELDQRTEQAENYLNAKKAELGRQDINSHVVIGKEPAVQAIIAEADRQEADLIAMASHGWTGLSQVFYGSVAAGVLNRVDRPILVIRSREENSSK